jgi:hypothetical protein
LYARNNKKYLSPAEHLWLPPVILATWKAEIRRIMLPGHFSKKMFSRPISMEKS